MKRPNGAVRILVYNWPAYVVTWALALAMFALAFLEPGLRTMAAIAGAVPILWSAVSLLVSLYIYDRSTVFGGTWISALLPTSVRNWATIHAGLDAEVELDGVMPGRCLARLDIFDSSLMTSASIKRARTHTERANTAVPCRPTALKLEDQACDTVVVAFAAHEIRNRVARERFFDELHRCLRSGGRVVLLEHLRDLANFLAFGPGCLHFLARREWLRLARKANLVVANETRITPFIMALALERTS